MTCTCPHIMLGSERTESKNWNPDCEEHGLESEWYNSPEEKSRRNKERQRTIELQRLAGQRRRGEISYEEAKKRLQQLEIT